MKYFILFLFVIITSNVSAIPGCVSNANNVMYTEASGGSGNYKGQGDFVNLNAGCYWIPTTNPITTCTITGSGPGVGPGYVAYDTPQNCDIDTNILWVLSGAVVFGFLIIRKKGNFSNNEIC